LASQVHFLGAMGSVAEKGGNPVKNRTSGHPTLSASRSQSTQGLASLRSCWTIHKYINAVLNAVHVPPLPMSLKELRDRITRALQTITADMLHRAWDEFDYRVDVCRVTQGSHIEGL
jgi:hypothetical protein